MPVGGSAFGPGEDLFLSFAAGTGDSDSINKDPLDVQDGGSGPHYPGACGGYAACVGSTGSDYWWETNQDGTANTPNRGIFKLSNNWSNAGFGQLFARRG